MSAIKVYSIDGCPPCEALKKWLRERNVMFLDIKVRTLSPAQRAWLREEVLAASRIKDPLMPAVWITLGNKKRWVVNNGDRGDADVSEMIEEIKKIFGLP